MFFEPQYWEKTDVKVEINSSAEIKCDNCYAKDIIQNLISDRSSKNGQIMTISAYLQIPENIHIDIGSEGYVILTDFNSIKLYAENHRGLIYAAQTLMQMEKHEGIFTGRLEDSPDCKWRGYRVFLPGRKSFKQFYKMVDDISYYKYNFITFEIGGAMEYKRHPEINKAWKEYVADTRRYSGRTKEIQNGYGWRKNSIHSDNGEGDVLTQNEVKELIDYCEYRGLNVFPEVPLLSHCDYICLAHKELSERKEDPYPDTYCPSNPKVYELVFDILDEVIQVFNPEIINIGHDEYYSICLCEKCKEKSAAEVFSNDVTKIHDYLAQRGIRTMMWGDKLLPVVIKTRTYGGAGEDKIDKFGRRQIVPPTFYCQNMLPRDILMLNWYHSFGMQYDFVFHTHGYEMIYGNMTAERLANWRERRNYGAKGGMCSNWGSFYEEYMQRNCQYLHLIFGAYALWSKSYSNQIQQKILTKTFHEAFHLHYGNLKEKPYIVIEHTTELNIPYKVFYDGIFIEEKIYDLGYYSVNYTDGTKAKLKVKYGTNISNEDLEYLIDDNKEGFNSVMLDESALGEISYSTIPFGNHGKTWYRTAYINPYPDKKIEKIEYVSIRPEQVYTLSIKY